MSAPDIKQIVYRYNGDSKSDEVVQDLVGEIPRHTRGEIIERKGVQWKVAYINDEFTVAGPKQVPIHHVFLTDSL